MKNMYLVKGYYLALFAVVASLVAFTLWAVAFGEQTRKVTNLQAIAEAAIMEHVSEFAYVRTPDGIEVVLGRSESESMGQFVKRIKAVASGEVDPGETFCATFSCPGLGTIRLCSSTQAGLNALTKAWCAQNPTCDGC